MNENAIELDHVTKSFSIYSQPQDTLYDRVCSIFKKKDMTRLTVLDDVSFTVKKGEMLGIIGRNGIGKTTLLRLIAKIYKPDSGTIFTDGTVIPLLELGTGFNPDLTARENILLYGQLLGFSLEKIKERVGTILEFAELEKFANVKIKIFSAGMYVRLAFSTAIQVDPDILLADEILSVGDLTFQQKSMEAFISFRKRGKTVLYVSHSLDSIKLLCDRALFLNDGKIIHIGKPTDVIDTYVRIFQERST
jgi:lipopolysaccharide transport system ATP-binding protein